MTDLEMKQQPDRYRYYITNDALLKGTFPYMGESDRIWESIKPLTFENGAVTAYGFVEYPAPLTQDQEKEYSLRPSSANANYLAAAEMSVEQNYNQIDGIVNNQEPPRVNQDYIIIDSETVGNHGFDFKWAEDIMDRIEREQQCTVFGNQEKNLVSNYAYHKNDTELVKNLINELAAARYEVKHGYADPYVWDMIQDEISEIDEMWAIQDENILEYRPVSFEKFVDHDLTGVDYILETGEKLHAHPPTQEYYVSENRLVDGTVTTPHIYYAAWHNMGDAITFRLADEVQLESPYKVVGEKIEIKQYKSDVAALSEKHSPDYVLKDGTELFKSERDAYGNYYGAKSIIGSDGLHELTGKLYVPEKDTRGQIKAFQEVKYSNLKNIGQKKQPSSILENLKHYREDIRSSKEEKQNKPPKREPDR